MRFAQKIPVGPVRSARIAYLQSPTTVASRVHAELPSSFVAIEQLEGLFPGGPAKPQVNRETQLVRYKSSHLTGAYNHLPYVPDPRQFIRGALLRCSLVKIHGVYLGTDKVGHFIGMGHLNYQTYTAARSLGCSQDEACQRARQASQYGPFSEWALLGGIPSGLYSNGDMAANYCGLKFYINLTEPIRLRGCDYPPLLTLEQGEWKLAPHVNRESSYWAMLLCPHFDEALNPCYYEFTFRHHLRKKAQQNAEQLVALYAGSENWKRSKTYFTQLVNECRTYYGEEYGRVGSDESLPLLDQVCQSVITLDEVPPPVVAIEHSHRERLCCWVKESSGAQRGERCLTLMVTNPTDEPLSNLAIRQQLPEQAQLLAVEQPAAMGAASLTWRIPRLAPHSYCELRVLVAAPEQVEVQQVSHESALTRTTEKSPPTRVVFSPERFSRLR